MTPRHFFVIAIISVAISPATAQVVLDPFKTPVSRQHFSQCFPEVKTEDLERLSNISKYGYDEFGPSVECNPEILDCSPGTKIFEALRRVEFRADELSEPNLRQRVFSAEGGECSYVRIRNFSYTLSRNQFILNFSPFQQQRKCVYGAKFDTGSSQADVHLWGILDENFNFSTGKSISNERGSLFGFIDANWLGGVIGTPLNNIVLSISLREIVAVLQDDRGFNSLQTATNFAQAGVNLIAYQNLQKKLDRLGTAISTEFKTRRDLSGLLSQEGSLGIEVVQSTYALELTRRHFERVRRLELDFLASLNEVEPKRYVVKKGDSLWSIVEGEYLDPRLHILIAKLNNLPKSANLRPGDILLLPRWQELCHRLGGNLSTVLAGESLWKKSEKGDIPRDFRKVKTWSEKKSLVYPLETLEILQ